MIINPAMLNDHDETYHKLLMHILKNGDSHQDRTGVGTTSVFGYQCRYNLRLGFPLLTTKKMAWKSIQTELRWFLLGRTDNQWLKEHGCSIWDEWATAEACAKFGRKEGDLGPVYGHQWRHAGQPYIGPAGWPLMSTAPNGEENQVGVIGYGDKGDQIKSLCNDLINNPNSRRMIVSGWDPIEATKVALPPCHTLWHCKVRTVEYPVQDGYELKYEKTQYLDLHLYQRSADSFLGVPFNIASYALLTHLLAAAHGFEPGDFIHTFGDLHIYNNHKEQVKEQLNRTPYNMPQLKVQIGRGFDGLMKYAETGDGVILTGYNSHPAIKAEVAV
jgi:thymidylate synthase